MFNIKSHILAPSLFFKGKNTKSDTCSSSPKCYIRTILAIVYNETNEFSFNCKTGYLGKTSFLKQHHVFHTLIF